MMTEAQLKRFELAVDRLVQASEKMSSHRGDIDRVRAAVEGDRGEEWKRDIKKIAENTEDILNLMGEDE